MTASLNPVAIPAKPCTIGIDSQQTIRILQTPLRHVVSSCYVCLRLNVWYGFPQNICHPRSLCR